MPTYPSRRPPAGAPGSWRDARRAPVGEVEQASALEHPTWTIALLAMGGTMVPALITAWRPLRRPLGRPRPVGATTRHRLGHLHPAHPAAGHRHRPGRPAGGRPVLTPVPTPISDRSDRLAELLAETSPEARRARIDATTWPALDALAPVLPDGRLPRGCVIEVVGDHYLLGALAAGVAQRPDVFVASVGLPDLGLAAMNALGIPYARLAVADDPGPHWAEVVAALAREGAFGVILLEPPATAQPRDRQRLAARLRESGTTLLVTTPWSGAALTLTSDTPRFAGLGDGWGQITSRTVTVHCTGRGRAGVRTRTTTLLLPGPDGTAQPLAPAAEQTVPTLDAATA
ncbi:hypothetical protein [Kitasatospora sp. NPDC050463]|uniref:hypothetical protein n=1 Tax=Kitasatospora sp. NPDC050463 TaxID=3155786 RepID=UPI0033EFFE05